MGSYLLRRLLLVIPTLFGIMLINFAVIQIVPGGPVEQMIAQMTGTAIESTARFSGNSEGEVGQNFNIDNSSNNDSKYRGAQGLDPDIIKEIEEMYGMNKPAHQRFFEMIKNYFSGSTTSDTTEKLVRSPSKLNQCTGGVKAWHEFKGFWR